MHIIKRVIILSLIILFSFQNSTFANEEESTNENVTIEQYHNNISGITELDEKRLANLIHSNKTYFLYIGYADCPYCREFSATLNIFKKESKLPIYYMNLAQESSNINNKKIEFAQDFIINKASFSGTPTILKVSKKNIVNNYVGAETSINDLRNINFKK